MMSADSSRCTLCGLYVVVLLIMLLNFHFIVITAHPLGKASGTKFKRSSHRPTYNGFLNYRSLNLSSLEASNSPSPWSNQLQTTGIPENHNQKGSNANKDDHEHDWDNSTPQPFGLSSILQNDRSSTLRDNAPSDLTTLPQIEVISKTITGDTVSIVERDVVSSGEVTRKADDASHEDSTEPGALEEGDDDKVNPADIDIFDNLMSSIHIHWQDFVSKMKLSVVDVWKSISNHMMNRLENFAVSM